MFVQRQSKLHCLQDLHLVWKPEEQVAHAQVAFFLALRVHVAEPVVVVLGPRVQDQPRLLHLRLQRNGDVEPPGRKTRLAALVVVVVVPAVRAQHAVACVLDDQAAVAHRQLVVEVFVGFNLQQFLLAECPPPVFPKLVLVRRTTLHVLCLLTHPHPWLHHDLLGCLVHQERGNQVRGDCRDVRRSCDQNRNADAELVALKDQLEFRGALRVVGVDPADATGGVGQVCCDTEAHLVHRGLLRGVEHGTVRQHRLAGQHILRQHGRQTADRLQGLHFVLVVRDLGSCLEAPWQHEAVRQTHADREPADVDVVRGAVSLGVPAAVLPAELLVLAVRGHRQLALQLPAVAEPLADGALQGGAAGRGRGAPELVLQRPVQGGCEAAQPRQGHSRMTLLHLQVRAELLQRRVRVAVCDVEPRLRAAAGEGRHLLRRPRVREAVRQPHLRAVRHQERRPHVAEAQHRRRKPPHTVTVVEALIRPLLALKVLSVVEALLAEGQCPLRRHPCPSSGAHALLLLLLLLLLLRPLHGRLQLVLDLLVRDDDVGRLPVDHDVRNLHLLLSTPTEHAVVVVVVVIVFLIFLLFLIR
eukprot:Rhum_TRINITY_DN14316_c20_g1::Rhum_TRINITY_DN14316_c20_g1_i1::g.82585::m.82585